MATLMPKSPLIGSTVPYRLRVVWVKFGVPCGGPEGVAHGFECPQARSPSNDRAYRRVRRAATNHGPLSPMVHKHAGGPPAYSVPSSRCRCSQDTPPKIIDLRRPLPGGMLSTRASAGCPWQGRAGARVGSTCAALQTQHNGRDTGTPTLIQANDNRFNAVRLLK